MTTGYVDPITYGADPLGVIDSAIAINNAQAAANTLGQPLITEGTFKVSSTVTINCDADLSLATFTTTNTSLSPVLRIGTTTSGSQLRRKRIIAPKVIQAGKAGLGNGTWGTDKGIELANLDSCDVFIPHVQGFAVGLDVSSYGAAGTSYTNVSVGHLDNNLINLRLLPGDASAWVNENTFDGPFRLSHNSNEGSSISGCRHILVGFSATHAPNNNLFIRPAIEGNGPEYHLYCYGIYNTFLSARWEATTPKVAFDSGNVSGLGSSNAILYGYKPENIVFTELGTPLPTYNSVFTRNGISLLSSSTSLVVANQGSSASNAIAVLAAGATLNTNEATDYLVGISGVASLYKRTADTGYRIKLDHSTPKMLFGDGTNQTTGVFTGSGSPEGVLTANVGSIYLRTNGGASTSFYVKESGTGNTGWVGK